MSDFLVVKAFRGCPQGSVVVDYEKDQVVTGDELGADLLAVALAEKWLRKAPRKAQSNVTPDPGRQTDGEGGDEGGAE